MATADINVIFVLPIRLLLFVERARGACCSARSIVCVWLEVSYHHTSYSEYQIPEYWSTTVSVVSSTWYHMHTAISYWSIEYIIGGMEILLPVLYKYKYQ